MEMALKHDTRLLAGKHEYQIICNQNTNDDNAHMRRASLAYLGWPIFWM